MPSGTERTGATFRATGCVLAFVSVVVVGFSGWLPDADALLASDPHSTEYTKFYEGRRLQNPKLPPIRMSWVSLNKISAHLHNAVLIAEDERFYRHHGVDMREAKKALVYNLRKGKLARGASTITQQMVRNLYVKPSLRRGDKLSRKVKEVLIASHLERTLGKERILEIYLNVVEWGEGIFGAEAASQEYFKKHAWELTPEEAVALAAALPSPYRYNPNVMPPDERTLAVRERYLHRMREAGYLSPGNKGDSVKIRR